MGEPGLLRVVPVIGSALARHGPQPTSAAMRPMVVRPKLLDQVREAIRTRHYSHRTEEAYVGYHGYVGDPRFYLVYSVDLFRCVAQAAIDSLRIHLLQERVDHYDRLPDPSRWCEWRPCPVRPQAARHRRSV